MTVSNILCFDVYHKNKIDEYDDLINIWGADHHGYIKGLRHPLKQLGLKEKLIVKLVQFANLSKMLNQLRCLQDLVNFLPKRTFEDIGSDAARFYYLSKQADQHLDFDIDLTKSDNKENIFYYTNMLMLEFFHWNKNTEMYPELDNNIEAIEKDLYKKCALLFMN